MKETQTQSIKAIINIELMRLTDGDGTWHYVAVNGVKKSGSKLNIKEAQDDFEKIVANKGEYPETIEVLKTITI